MDTSSLRRIVRFKIALLSLCISVPAMAQYAWIDSNNIRHYSDMPPPASVPSSRILKMPRGSKSHVSYEEVKNEPAAGEKVESARAPAPITLADKNAEFQKRRMEQAEKDKKAEQEAKQAEDKEKNCERARGYKKALENGHRIAQTSKSGEKEILNDQQRARELEEVNRSLERCK